MLTSVIKKNGKKVPFDPEKIKSAIAGACTDAGVADAEKHIIVEQVSASMVMDFMDKTEVTTDQIKEKILDELDNSSPFVAKHWREYEQGKRGE